MALFNGTLNRNEVQLALFNMIISQRVEASNIKGTYSSLVEKAREQGSKYGDKILVVDTDILETHEWGGDSEATNLLAVDRPPAPKTQEFVLDKFRQVRVTVDDYLSARAFSSEGVFMEYNGVVLAWLADTKRVYESRLYNQFIGCHVSAVGRQSLTIDITSARASGTTEEEKNRLEASVIGEEMANLVVDLKDTTRDFNDYGFMRSYTEDEIHVVWSSRFISKIKYVDLPTIFHKDGMIQKFEEEVLPARYFGRAVAESDIGSGKVIGADGAYDSTKGTLRAAAEFDYNDKHYFPGDALATSGTYVAVAGGLEASQVYLEDPSIMFKIMVKEPPLLSSFSAGTSFFNARALLTNHYLTWSYNTLDHYYGKPFITVKKI
jgi:hypothetical protein